MWIKKDLVACQLHKIQDKNEVTRVSDQITRAATDVQRSLRQVHRQRRTCERSWTQASFTKYKRRMRWQEIQIKPQEKQQMQREAWDKYTDRDTHVIKKYGRRPAPENTRQEWDGKSFGSNHRRRNRCKEKLEAATQTETRMWLKKELAAGQLYEIQEKNEMARASDQTTAEATDVNRSGKGVHSQRHTCD